MLNSHRPAPRLRNSGTDANVFLELHGTKGFIGETRLDNAANNFERGVTDVFKLQGSDIGDATRLVIRHDNSRPSPDWHLQQVRGSYKFRDVINNTHMCVCV